MNALALCRLTRVFLIASLMLQALPVFAAVPTLESRIGIELREQLRVAESGDLNTVLSFFVKTYDVMTTLHEIEAMGGTVGTISGDILTVRMPAHGFTLWMVCQM